MSSGAMRVGLKRRIENMNVEILKKEIHVKALVESESHKGAYYVVENENGEWTCTCPDATFRGRGCKHILEVAEVSGANQP